MIDRIQYEKITQDFNEVQSWSAYETHSKYAVHKPMFEKILGKPELFDATPQMFKSANGRLRVTSWNIEHGMALPSIIQTLKEHPVLSTSDILLLTEVDCGMARSSNVHVARELSEKLNLYAAYVPCYFNLDRGSGVENFFIQGTNVSGLQGHAILSRYPIRHARAVCLPNTKDHLHGKERQIGNEYALIVNIQHPAFSFDAVCVHLAEHSSRKQRVAQMKEISKSLHNQHGRAIMGGDLNTSTYNSNSATRAILRFWRRVSRSSFHETYFEKKLFQTMRDVGFTEEGFDLKLDAFLGRRFKPVFTEIVNDLPRGNDRYSDHNPMVVDILPQNA